MELSKCIFEIIFDDENKPIDIKFEGKKQRTLVEDKVLGIIKQKQIEGMEFKTNKCCLFIKDEDCTDNDPKLICFFNYPGINTKHEEFVR